jgi:hypothetical protein
MNVLLSVRTEILASRWEDLLEIRHLIISWKYVEKIQVSLKSEKNNRYIT